MSDEPPLSPSSEAQASGPPLQVDPAEASDTDSAYGDDAESYTTSLTESVTNYEFEYGRRYHAYQKGAYILPNDEQEKDRLDIMHHLIKILLGDKLHLAPIGKNPHRILDLGTGTGIWAIDMGDAYPSAEVLGNDLSPIQPMLVPPNVKFEVDDIENVWTHNSPFDFIHCRAMAACIADWPRLAKQSFESSKPGGWVEFVDFDMKIYASDGSLSEDNPLSQWNRDILKAANMIGREPNPGPFLAGFLRDAGFESVKEEVYRVPIGIWPKDKAMKEVGAFNLLQLSEGLEAFTLALFTRVLGWSAEGVQVLLASVRKSIRTRSIHSQYNMHVVYAQKPE